METVLENRGILEQLALMKKEMVLMRRTMEEMNVELKAVKKENEEQKKTIVLLEDRVEYLDNQSRRDNLVIRGIPEMKGETKEECEEEVIKLGQQIGVKLSRADFTRAHRVQSKTDGPRPIVAKFTSCRKREEMLKEKKHLRGTNYFVMEDFSKRVIEERKILYEEARKKRTDGENAHVRFNRLYTSKGVFRWDGMKGLVQVGGQQAKEETMSDEDLKIILDKLNALENF